MQHALVIHIVHNALSHLHNPVSTTSYHPTPPRWYVSTELYACASAALTTCRFVAGQNPGDAADQLKQLIRELHREGLEVLLEVSTDHQCKDTPKASMSASCWLGHDFLSMLLVR